MSDDQQPKITFNWTAWWASDRVGVIWAAILCLAMPVMGVIAAISDGTPYDPWFLWYGLMSAVWCAIYVGGWNLLVMATLRLRARFGWITYRSGKPDL